MRCFIFCYNLLEDIFMNRLIKLFFIPLIVIGVASCDFSGDDPNIIHKESYEPITGKFVLFEATDKRLEDPNAYFEFDGSKGNFSMKYYENGELKKEGKFNRIVTRQEYVGKIKDNLHFNVQIGYNSEHIGTYSESLDPIDQFRIIEEYTGSETKYYYSELPYIIGTYVREGKEYKEEAKVSEGTDYSVPTVENFSCLLNGKYALSEDTYFYFVYPYKNDYYAKAYFQYFAPGLEKPLEGFAAGRTYTNLGSATEMIFTYSRQVSMYKAGGKSDEGGMYFGYYSIDSNDRLIEHWGSVNYQDGNLISFTFEHLSRTWTDAEMDKWTRDLDYQLPDPIYYEYIGGTYSKVN